MKCKQTSRVKAGRLRHQTRIHIYTLLNLPSRNIVNELPHGGNSCRMIFFILVASIASMRSICFSQTNWEEYYPLHIGNLWEYQGYSNNIPIKITEEVLSDTLMTNGEVYRVVRYKEHDGPFPHESFTFRRVDTAGHVWFYKSGDCEDRLAYKLNGQVGDTLENSCVPTDPSYWKMIEKGPAIIFDDTCETQTWDLIDSPILGVVTLAARYGLVTERGEFWERYLRGALINGEQSGHFTVSIQREEVLAPTFVLHQNYPNPFNSSTRVRYSLLKTEEDVSIRVYDITGKKVREFLDVSKEAGSHEVVWDGRDDSGLLVPSGAYIIRIVSDGHAAAIKMILSK